MGVSLGMLSKPALKSKFLTGFQDYKIQEMRKWELRASMQLVLNLVILKILSGSLKSWVRSNQSVCASYRPG